MPKRLPTYSLHKATGQARVWLGGKSHYLGPFGSPESRIKYGELIAKHASGVPVDPLKPIGQADSGPTVTTISNAFLEHAKVHYCKNGKQTDEVACIRSAMGHLCTLFGHLPAKDFGPLALKAVRQRMIESTGKSSGKPLSRGFINRSVERIRRIFKHAVSNELIQPSVLVGLQTVPALEAGRTAAVDYAPRSSLPSEQIEAVRAIVNQRTKDLMDLALLTGARPGELCGLTGRMIDKTDDIWFAALDDHKTVHQGKARTLVFGPKSQEILRRYLVPDLDRRLFVIQRRTFSHCSGTAIRKSHGLDATQAALGHASRATTERYAHPVSDEAKAVARDRG
jgi:integrase